MKILFASDVSIARVIGGAERVLYEQSTRLAHRGHEIHLLTRRLPEHGHFREKIKGAQEWRFPVQSANAFSFLFSSLFHSTRMFAFLEKEIGFDCLHFHQPLTGFGVLLSPRTRNLPKIYTCHSLAFEEYQSRHSKPDSPTGTMLYRVHIFLRRQMEKNLLRASDRILVLSNYTLAKLRTIHDIPEKKIILIPGGVDLQGFHPAENKNSIRRKYGFPENIFTVLTVRNLVPRMGLENLIQAVRILADTTPDVHIVIGGDGPLRDELRELSRSLGLERHICFAGFIPEADLPEYYRMADVFVLPTRELEGFGLVTLEALASGIPVLGTRVGGTKEILGRFNPSLLFKDISPASIADLMAKTFWIFKNNAAQWQKLGTECRRHAEENYSWENHVHCVEKTMESLRMQNHVRYLRND